MSRRPFLRAIGLSPRKRACEFAALVDAKGVLVVFTGAQTPVPYRFIRQEDCVPDASGDRQGKMLNPYQVPQEVVPEVVFGSLVGEGELLPIYRGQKRNRLVLQLNHIDEVLYLNPQIELRTTAARDLHRTFEAYQGLGIQRVNQPSQLVLKVGF